MAIRNIIAKFASPCAYSGLSGCKKEIKEGEQVYWEKGRGAWHASCGPTGVDPQADREIMQGMAEGQTWSFLKNTFGENSRELLDYELRMDDENVGGPFY